MFTLILVLLSLPAFILWFLIPASSSPLYNNTYENFFLAIQHHQPSGYTLLQKWKHHNCSYESIFLPLSCVTHTQPKPFDSIDNQSFYKSPPRWTVPCGVPCIPFLLWATSPTNTCKHTSVLLSFEIEHISMMPDNRAELCQRVSSRVISCDLGTISERALPHGVPCLPRWPSRNHLHLVGQQMLPSQSSTMARLGPQMHPGFICTPPGDHSHI